MTKKTPSKSEYTLAPRAAETRAVKLNAGSQKARRSAARLAAVQVLYQMEFNQESAHSALNDFINTRDGFEFDGDIFVPADRDLLSNIIDGIDQKHEELRAMVDGQLAKKSKEDIDPILKAVLTAAFYELLAHHDIDAPIIISDYMNVAHAFYEDGAPKMINAILDGFSKSVR